MLYSRKIIAHMYYSKISEKFKGDIKFLDNGEIYCPQNVPAIQCFFALLLKTLYR